MKRTLATILGLAAVLAVAGVRAANIPQIDGETRAKLSRSFIAKDGGTSTGLTNTGGFFLGGTGVIGTNGSPSTLTVNMVTTFTNVVIRGNAPLLINTNAAPNPSDTIVVCPNPGQVQGVLRFLPSGQGYIYVNRLYDNGSGYISLQLGGVNGAVTAMPDAVAGTTWTMSQNLTVVKAIKTGGGAFFTSNNTAVLVNAAWPALATIGTVASNVVALTGATISNTSYHVQVIPADNSSIYRADFFTNNAAVIYKVALVADLERTNTVRVSIVDW